MKYAVHMDELELETLLPTIRDSHLRHTITFGIGLHHAGLHTDDRKLVENLFEQTKIQVCVYT